MDPDAEEEAARLLLLLRQGRTPLTAAEHGIALKLARGLRNSFYDNVLLYDYLLDEDEPSTSTHHQLPAHHAPNDPPDRRHPINPASDINNSARDSHRPDESMKHAPSVSEAAPSRCKRPSQTIDCSVRQDAGHKRQSQAIDHDIDLAKEGIQEKDADAVIAPRRSSRMRKPTYKAMEFALEQATAKATKRECPPKERLLSDIHNSDAHDRSNAPSDSKPRVHDRVLLLKVKLTRPNNLEKPTVLGETDRDLIRSASTHVQAPFGYLDENCKREYSALASDQETRSKEGLPIYTPTSHEKATSWNAHRKLDANEWPAHNAKLNVQSIHGSKSSLSYPYPSDTAGTSRIASNVDTYSKRRQTLTPHSPTQYAETTSWNARRTFDASEWPTSNAKVNGISTDGVAPSPSTSLSYKYISGPVGTSRIVRNIETDNKRKRTIHSPVRHVETHNGKMHKNTTTMRSPVRNARQNQKTRSITDLMEAPSRTKEDHFEEDATEEDNEFEEDKTKEEYEIEDADYFEEGDSIEGEDDEEESNFEDEEDEEDDAVKEEDTRRGRHRRNH